MSLNRQPIWTAGIERSAYPILTGDVEVDVAVIGAGIVGILTAWHLKKAGFSVALIESRRALSGVTGHTTAKLTASHGLIYDYLYSTFGVEKASLYATANTDAIQWVEDVCASEGIECRFKRSELYLYAEDQSKFADLIKERDAAKLAGLETSLVASLDMPFPNAGALAFHKQAQFDPVQFLQPILDRIPGGGCSVFEGSRVIEVTEDNPCLTRTEFGDVRSDHVVVASNFPVYDPAAFYARLKVSRDYAIAVDTNKPIPDSLYVGSAEGYTLRPVTNPSDGQPLLVVSGEVHKTGEGEDQQSHYDHLEIYAREHFGATRVAYAWSSQDPSTLDRVPFIGRISLSSEKITIATGFGGWGMTHGVIAGQLLCDIIRQIPNPYEQLYTPERFPIMASAGELTGNVVSTVKHFVGDFFRKTESLDSLDPGQGAIVETASGKVAAFKDRAHMVHAVSPNCTHMGCTLAWNTAEETWDCPCHGSRFDTEGVVLHGPAVTDLAKIDLYAPPTNTMPSQQ